MNKKFKDYISKLFDRKMDFRVRLFHVLALAGIGISTATLVISVVSEMWQSAVISFALILLSTGLFLFTYKTGKYQLGYGITIAAIFMLAFPMLFFVSGGYRSGMPAVFIFAVLFTVLMLTGKKALIVSFIEIVEYSCVCIYAYYHPEHVTHFDTEAEVLTDIIFATASVSIATGIVLFLHLREYLLQRDLLQEQNEKLRRYDESRTSFLTTVSHEIKNPLNAINLHARDTIELMEEKPLDLKLMRENQQVIERMVVRIDKILIDLKDTVAIEQGRLSLSVAPMRVEKLLEEVTETYFGKNYTAGNELILDIKEKVPPIYADYARLMQVMTNLLSNAIQHTKNGTITISLMTKGEYQLISVEDNGEGMPEELRAKALEGYVSASEDYWRHGIGLYVCHQIVEAHGGDIWIESRLGEGTKVFFTLPQRGDESNG